MAHSVRPLPWATKYLCWPAWFGYYYLMSNGHDYDHEGSHLSEMELRVRALESVLQQKGYIDPAAIDLLIERYEKKIGPRNGATVVAKAWASQEFKQRLLAEPAQTL